MLLPLFAFLGPDQLGVFIPILAVVAGIVAILTRHQQRMAEIIHGTAQAQSTDEIVQLRKEVFELKQMVHEQMIALDSYAGSSRQTDDVPLQKRLEQI
jgi:uncharacterized protein YlxW (UPF0749 family)